MSKKVVISYYKPIFWLYQIFEWGYMLYQVTMSHDYITITRYKYSKITRKGDYIRIKFYKIENLQKRDINRKKTWKNMVYIIKTGKGIIKNSNYMSRGTI